MPASMYDLSVYNDHFHDDNAHEQRLMAIWLMPLLRELFSFTSFFDVGCGSGEYVKWCNNNDIPAMGVEGSRAGVVKAYEKCIWNVLHRDLRKPTLNNFDCSPADLTLCFEVAEHIEAAYADVFLDNLCGTSSRWIVMTAASPGQGGLQHVNEQPQDYWVEKMSARGWRRAKEQEEALAHFARSEGGYLTPWLLPNLMVFRKEMTTA